MKKVVLKKLKEVKQRKESLNEMTCRLRVAGTPESTIQEEVKAFWKNK